MDRCLPARPSAAPEPFDFGFVGEATIATLRLDLANPCPTPPTATVRLRAPSGEERAAQAVEVFAAPDTVQVRVTFVADAVGSWSMEARFSQSLGQVQREVPIVEDLREAPRVPFPLEGACATPLLTPGGAPLCVDQDRVRWPGGGDAGAQALTLWVGEAQVWLAGTTLRVLQGTGDGGFLLGPQTLLPGSPPLFVSGAGPRAVVVQAEQTSEWLLDDAGAPQRVRVLPFGGGVASAAQSGRGAVTFTPRLGDNTLCQLDEPGDGGACQVFVGDVTGRWVTLQGLWLRLPTPVGFALQFVDPASPSSALLSGATVAWPGQPEVGASFDSREMTALALSGPPERLDAREVVLLPRVQGNAVGYQAVLRQPTPDLTFSRATGTHVFYRDTRGPSRWRSVRRY